MLTLPQARIRPPVLPFSVDFDIEGFTLLNYAVPPARLQGVLPDYFIPLTRRVEGHERAWLSVFMGRLLLRRVGGMPAVPIQLHQINYRTYIVQDEGHALYIFRSLIGPALYAQGLRILPGLPAHGVDVTYDLTWADEQLARVEAKAGDELELFLEYAGPTPVTPGFASAEAAVQVLGDVADAYFPLPDDRFGLMHSPHEPLRPQGGTLSTGRLDWLTRHEILTPDEVLTPASVFMQGCAPFPTYV